MSTMNKIKLLETSGIDLKFIILENINDKPKLQDNK